MTMIIILKVNALMMNVIKVESSHPLREPHATRPHPLGRPVAAGTGLVMSGHVVVPKRPRGQWPAQRADAAH